MNSYKIEIYLDYDINKIDSDIDTKIQKMINNIDCNAYDWKIGDNN